MLKQKQFLCVVECASQLIISTISLLVFCFITLLYMHIEISIFALRRPFQLELKRLLHDRDRHLQEFSITSVDPDNFEFYLSFEKFFSLLKNKKESR